MTDLTLDLRVPQEAVGRGVLDRDHLCVMHQAEIAEIEDYRIELVVEPMARHFLEFRPEIVERIIVRIHLVDHAACRQ